MPFKDISDLELWWPSGTAERNILIVLADGIIRDISVHLFCMG